MQFHLITDTASLCRLCMTAKEGNRTNLYDSASFIAEGQPSLHQMLKIICAEVFIKAETDDPPGMPKEVCASCRSATVEAFKLHQMCVETDRRLGELLALRWELHGPDNEDPLEHSDKDGSGEQLIQSLDQGKMNDPLSNNEHFVIKDEPLDLIDEYAEDYHDSNNQQDLCIYDPGTNLHACKICNRSFKKPSALKVHITLCHKNLLNSNEVFVCNLCGETFKSHGRYRYHKNKHGGNYICPCGKPFGTIGSFNTHIRNGACTGDLSTKCEECDKVFPSVYAITNHRRLKHSEPDKTAQIETGPADNVNNKCEECDQIFSSASAVADHRELMHSNRIIKMESFHCDLCESTFTNEDDLNLHKRSTHETSEPSLIDKTGEDSDSEQDGVLVIKEEDSQQGTDMEVTETEDVCHDSNSQQDVDMGETEIESTMLHGCELCDKYFKKASALKVHIALRHKTLLNSKETFMCDLCGETFKSHGRYRYHKNKHGGNYICPCGKPFVTIRSFHTHIKSGTCTGDQSTRCEECDKDFPSIYAITNHRRLKHSQSNNKAKVGTSLTDKNKCEECNKLFPSAYTVAIHRKMVHNISVDGGEDVERFACEECGSNFITKQKLKRHRRVMHNHKDLYECAFCDETFESAMAKRSHTKTHKGPFTCKICSKLLRTRASLKNHMLRHKKTKPFACKSCPMRFFTIAEINEHILTHTKSKNHTCEICGSRFSKHFSLVKHIRFVHEGQRPCECHVCGFKCSITSQLKRHLLTHTGEKPFKCGSCDMAYAQSNDLVKHVARVHGLDKPYQCDRCDESFRLLTDLRQHYRVHAQPEDGSEQTEEVRFTSMAILQRAFAKDKQQQEEKEKESE